MSKREPPRYQVEAEAAEKLAALARAENEGRRIKADLTRQAPNNSYGPPKLYYEDLEFTCRDCGVVEVWTAKQQQWWYEVAKGAVYSTAARCRPCRRARRGIAAPPVPDSPPTE